MTEAEKLSFRLATIGMTALVDAALLCAYLLTGIQVWLLVVGLAVSGVGFLIASLVVYCRKEAGEGGVA